MVPALGPGALAHGGEMEATMVSHGESMPCLDVSVDDSFSFLGSFSDFFSVWGRICLKETRKFFHFFVDRTLLGSIK